MIDLERDPCYVAALVTRRVGRAYVNRKDLSFDTRLLHSEGHDKPLNSHSIPIFQSSTFYFDSPEKGADLFSGASQGHIYTRLGNPTTEALEGVMASIEEADGAVAFSSGMAAITASILPFVGSGDHVISGDTLYGPSIHLIKDVFGRFGVKSSFVDTSDLGAVRSAFRKETRLVFFETPANPTCRITDIAAVSEIAAKNKAMVVVDNTFSTPALQRPLSLGAQVSVYSATKYLNGHGDIVGGMAAAGRECIEKIRTFRKDTGAILSPFESFLFLRGLKTLGMRMRKHHENAVAAADFLKGHPKVEKVHFPGHEDFPNHAVARKQMKAWPSCFSFELRGGLDSGRRLLSSTRICTLAVSLGTLDTLIQHPASMTHAGVPREMRMAQGLTDGLVRISVGCEDAADIISDLRQALDKA